MNIEDKKEELAELFFQCARYERPSTDWKDALNKFVIEIEAVEREACAKFLEGKRYMTLEPLKMYTADEAWQKVRMSVKSLASQIRNRSNV